jgi:hypothetical protein
VSAQAETSYYHTVCASLECDLSEVRGFKRLKPDDKAVLKAAFGDDAAGAGAGSGKKRKR